MLRILESQFIGNLADRLFRSCNHLFGYVNHSGLDVFLCAFSGFFLYQVTEVVG